jgi:hypothetical protein
VDGAGGCDGDVRAPPRAHFLQHDPSHLGAAAAARAPGEHVDLDGVRHVPHAQHPLGIPPAAAAVTRVPRLSPPQVQPKLRHTGADGHGPRHRRPVAQHQISAEALFPLQPFARQKTLPRSFGGGMPSVFKKRLIAHHTSGKDDRAL